MHIYMAFIENSNSFCDKKCCSTLRTAAHFTMWRSDMCKMKSVSGLSLASRWLLALSCVLNCPLIRSTPLCVSGTLLTMLSAICIRTLKSSSLALAVQHNETPVEAPAHLLPYYIQHDDIFTLPSKLLHCLFLLKKYIRSLRSQENQFTSCSLWVWRVMRWLLSSRKMYIFAEDRNWLFFCFILHPSLHQCLIWIHVRWHPSSFFYCCTDVAPSFYSLSNSYIWTVKPRGHKQPVAQINLLLEKEAYF